METRPAKRALVDAVSEHGEPVPQPILDNDYEIRVCLPDPHEDPVQNRADAEREAQHELQFTS